MDLTRVNEIIDRYPPQKSGLIQLLLDIQSEFHWIPKEAILLINAKFRIPISQIYRVASFYKAMSLTPKGKHMVSICLGTACHVRGGPRIVEKAEENLGIKSGETTADMKFSLERVNCLGCCALGPVMLVDKDYHGKVTQEKVKVILKKYD